MTEAIETRIETRKVALAWWRSMNRVNKMSMINRFMPGRTFVFIDSSSGRIEEIFKIWRLEEKEREQRIAKNVGKVTVKLTVTIDYDLLGTPIEDIKSQLEAMISSSAHDGLLTGELPAEVDDWYVNFGPVK